MKDIRAIYKLIIQKSTPQKLSFMLSQDTQRIVERKLRISVEIGKSQMLVF